MSKSNIARQFRQVQPGALHVGVDLALEKNVVNVINEQGHDWTVSVFLKIGEVTTIF